MNAKRGREGEVKLDGTGGNQRIAGVVSWVGRDSP